ncbi:MAG: hypothetical protein R3263_00080 [Myxococcota bacterium]|nr:hypothetical protein [Myxococcota bacterium]
MGERGPQEGGGRSGGTEDAGRAPEARRAVRHARDARVRRARLALGAVGAVAAVHLLWTRDPWSRGVAARIDLDAYVAPPDAMPFVWCGSLLVAGVAALLAATAPRWMGPRAAPEDPALAAPPRPGRLFAAVVAGAVLVTGALAVPRLDLGLWSDEVYSARHSMTGRYRMRGDDARYVPVGWRETLWHYRMPNNHVPYSLAARLTATVWQALAEGGERLRIEVPLRLPALAAGLLMPPAAALLLWRLGLPAAGALAAWLLALHPWMVRYASEARGYSAVMLLVTLLVASVVAVVRRGSWASWLAFGALQLLLLWTWPAALPVVACANAILGLLLARRLAGAPLRAQLVRQLVVGVAGATLFLWLMLPNLIQLAGYTAEKQRGAMDVGWWQDLGAHLLAGMHWRVGDHPLVPQLADAAAAAPGLLAAAAAFAGLAVALGGLRLVRRHGDVGAGVMALFLLPAPGVIALGAARGSFLHPWYLVFALPGLAMLVATGAQGLLETLARRAPAAAGRALRVGGALGLLGAFVGLTAPMHAAMHDHTFSALRRSVLLTRPSLDPNTPANRRILTASLVDLPEYYDPRCVGLRSPRQLRALMRRADAEDLTLYVNTGRIRLARRRAPQVVALLEDPARFEPVATLHSLVPRLTRHVYRYRGGAVDAGPRAAPSPRETRPR